jgi:hypothetical protein
MRVFWQGVLSIITIAGLAGAQAKPSDPPITHVLLISLDGMHALDLENYMRAHPESTLAQLAQHGIIYTEAQSSLPSNSWPGLLAMVTGGSPASTGVIFENSYDHALSPPGSNCTTRGTRVLYDSSIDRDPNAPDGGGIDPNKLPRDPDKGCTPVYPHQFVRVNNIFEVVKASGRRTAWSDKHPAYEFLKGPSGAGVDDLYVPEIRSATRSKNIAKIEEFDDVRVQALIQEIHGRDHTGTTPAAVPALFGMNFQAISMAQKLPGNGYKDGEGTPSAGLQEVFDHTDKSLRKLVAALQSERLFDSTLIIISAKHGDVPIDPHAVQYTSLDLIPRIVNGIRPGLLAFADQDGTMALLWLTDHDRAIDVARALEARRTELNIEKVYAGESLLLRFNDPHKDNRMPDVLVQPRAGVIYTDANFIAEHGGFTDDDTHVPLLLSRTSFAPRRIKSPVRTAQIAPTVLKALGLDPASLDAVRTEMTPPLPGVPFAPPSAAATQ